jgi:DNA-binding transcriptional LysR family regulator
MESERVPPHSDVRFTRTDLARDILDMALPASHPLARRPEVSLAAFAGECFVAPPLDSTCDDVVRGACAASGFTPLVAHRSADWSAVMALVGAGLGVACVPRLAQGDVPAGVAIKPIAGEAPCRHLFIACRRGGEDHPLLRAVVDALCQAAVAVRLRAA